VSAEVLSAAELRFVNVVAARRFAPGVDGAPPANTQTEVSAAGTAFSRAAALAISVLQPGAFINARLPTALLAVCCQLRREGYRLVAPQGAAAGMVRGLDAGRVNAVEFAAWLQDRAVED